MALIELDEAKEFLDVYISQDNAKIQALLTGSIDEAVQYLGYDNATEYEAWLTSSDNPNDNPPESVITAIKLLLQAKYQSPVNEIEPLRKAAEVLLNPFRIGWGV